MKKNEKKKKNIGIQDGLESTFNWEINVGVEVSQTLQRSQFKFRELAPSGGCLSLHIINW